MLKISPPVDTDEGHVDLSCTASAEWNSFSEFGSDQQLLLVQTGDTTAGPAIACAANAPGVAMPLAPAHGHASDSFRISVLGTFNMGSETYSEGEFRLQPGWKAYAGDNTSCGPDGGWQILVMADRRGSPMRLVKAQLQEEVTATEAALVPVLGLDPEIYRTDRPDVVEPSAMRSTLIRRSRAGKLNGSFADRSSWPAIDSHTRAAVSLLGDPVCGPVIILSVTGADQEFSARARYGTEVFRVVVDGSCDIGGRIYRKGDIRVQKAGQWCDPVVAGPEGLQQVLVIGDRRHTVPQFETDSAADELTKAIRGLMQSDSTGYAESASRVGV